MLMMLFIFLLLILIALVDSVNEAFNCVVKTKPSNFLITMHSIYFNGFIIWLVAGIENRSIWIGHFLSINWQKHTHRS